HRLRMARRPAADHLVPRGTLLAARIARDRLAHALHVLEYALDAPEASTSEHGDFRSLRAGRLIDSGGRDHMGDFDKQTRARILRGDTRADGKILSLFEPATEVIAKGKVGKPNEFGKMVKQQETENQIVTDYEVYDRRLSDSDLLIGAVE